MYAFEDDPGAVKAFIYELSDAFAADDATAHILTKDQERRKLQARVERAWLKSPALAKKYEEQMKKNLEEWPKRRALGPEITAINVKRGCIAELNWLNVFGPPYVALFGRERLLATPAHEVRQLPYGGDRRRNHGRSGRNSRRLGKVSDRPHTRERASGQQRVL